MSEEGPGRPIAVDLINNVNAQYEGALWLGGNRDVEKMPPQKLSFIFDTGSPTMWVQSTKCDHQCTGNPVEYNYTASQFEH